MADSANSSTKVQVSLIFHGDHLLHQKIEELIGLKPRRSNKKGVTTVLSSGKQIAAKTGVWSTAISDPKTSPTAHLEYALQCLESELFLRLEDLGIESTKIAVYCSTSNPDYDFDLQISSEVAGILHKLDAQLSVEFVLVPA